MLPSTKSKNSVPYIRVQDQSGHQKPHVSIYFVGHYYTVQYRLAPVVKSGIKRVKAFFVFQYTSTLTLSNPVLFEKRTLKLFFLGLILLLPSFRLN